MPQIVIAIFFMASNFKLTIVYASLLKNIVPCFHRAICAEHEGMLLN
jgi:hypothetical protein